MDYDKIIEENPKLRRWQYCVAGLLWLPTLSAGLNIMSYTFAGFAPPHRCHIPCEDDLSNQTELDLSARDWYQQLDTSEINTQCQFYKYRGGGGVCHVEDFDISEVEDCTQFVYDRSVFTETLVTNFDLVCKDRWKKGFIGTLYMVGLFIGSYIIGYAGDKIGRKKTMMISLLFLIIGGALAGVMPFYSLYVICYVIASIAGYGMFVLPFLITVELLPSEKKTFVSMMINFPFVIGETMMCVIAWLTKDYSTMHLAGYLPLVALFPLWFLLPESPRWLLAKGRQSDLRRELSHGARWAGISLKKELRPDPDGDGDDVADGFTDDNSESAQTNYTEVGFLDILKSKPLLIRLLVNYINWTVINLCYYGLTMNSVNLNGNTFINTILGVMIEAPGYLLAMLTMDRWGRKPILVLCQLGSGVVCIAAGLSPTNIPYLVPILSCVGKLLTSAAFSLIYLYTAEMFPTEVRTKALGTCSMVARLGSFISPYIASLGSSASSGYIPFIIFGVSTLLGGSTAILLPETIGTQLPVTIKDAENLVKTKDCSKSSVEE